MDKWEIQFSYFLRRWDVDSDTHSGGLEQRTYTGGGSTHCFGTWIPTPNADPLWKARRY